MTPPEGHDSGQKVSVLAPTPIAQPGNLGEMVAQQLLGEIREKELPKGTKLPTERELMGALRVGRSTVREAINGLAILGVLEIRRGQGAFVLNPEAGLEKHSAITLALARGVTRDLFEARRLVEPFGASLAAERRTESDLNEIAQALVDHEEAVRRGDLAVEPSVRFHLQIAEATHNDVLAGFVHSFQDPLAQRGPVLEEMEGFREWEIEQHRSVLEPIQAGDAKLAHERMLAHLDAVLPYHEHLGLS
jgi:GntR family transcriptional repressor for pyruvate dehydrogenase complex